MYLFSRLPPGAGNLCGGKLKSAWSLGHDWPTAANIPKVRATPEKIAQKETKDTGKEIKRHISLNILDRYVNQIACSKSTTREYEWFNYCEQFDSESCLREEDLP